MNENNNLAYPQNDSAQNEEEQTISVYAQGDAEQNNPEPVQENSVQDDSVSVQENSVQENPMSADPIPAQDNSTQASDAPAQNSTVSLQKDNAQNPYPQDNAPYHYPQDSNAPYHYPQNNNVTNNYPQNGNAPYNYIQNDPAYMPNSPMGTPVYNNTPLLQLNDLCKRYPGMGTYMSVFHMNLIIPRGRIIGLLGPNGCGKTTLIKMINGLLAPTCGNVLINGMEPCPATKKVISYLPERTYLDNSMKVSQMVTYFADFYEDFSTEKAYGMLSALGISSDARLKTLSKGTKEKVQLILVMSRQADLYILDEPIAGVDPAARDYILRTIITNYNPGSTIILSTHLISDIENILDDVIFMKNGSLMLYTSVDSIRSQMGKSVDSYFREVYAC